MTSALLPDQEKHRINEAIFKQKVYTPQTVKPLYTSSKIIKPTTHTPKLPSERIRARREASLLGMRMELGAISVLTIVFTLVLMLGFFCHNLVKLTVIWLCILGFSPSKMTEYTSRVL